VADLRTWLALLAATGSTAPPGKVAAAGERLLAAYAEPHRAYHDRRHLAEVLERVDLLADEAGDVVAVRLAAWYHDAVYDGTAEAEERSAVLAERDLGALGVPVDLVARVARLVRLTATHDVADDDADGAVLADADLGILAATPERYAQYAADVRREYAAVDDATFAATRAAVLQRLVRRPRLFHTAGATAWEQRARRNVAEEVARLTARADDAV
jgi:predicted metal-dependent HD superfamily phosphohydrolase